MGTEVFTREVLFNNATLLVTFGGNFTTRDRTVTNVEVSDIAGTIDFRFVEPSWGSDDDESE